MGGGDKRPDDSDDDSDEYEDREPDEFQVDLSSLVDGSDGGSEGPTTLSDFGGGADNPVDRVQKYAEQGNGGSDGNGGSGSDTDSDGSTLSDFGGGIEDSGEGGGGNADDSDTSTLSVLVEMGLRRPVHCWHSQVLV